ncbi:MAG: hypothetical protein KDD55_10880, partial [Bdellovibrionales bacterium]|nr:hypothetical protein [Bdellovibrionales bacterium]
MLQYIARKIFGTSNDRYLKAQRPLVAQVNELEPIYKKMSDDELRRQTEVFRSRLE